MIRITSYNVCYTKLLRIAHVEGKSLVIEVKDHGCGITNEIGGRIFNAHFTTKATGNGLGLFSCKQIVEQKHGGSISCFSSPLSGTIFKVVLHLTVITSYSIHYTKL